THIVASAAAAPAPVQKLRDAEQKAEQKQESLVYASARSETTEIVDWDPCKIDDEFWLQPLGTIQELFAHTFRPLQQERQQSSRRMQYTQDVGLSDADMDGSG